MVTEGIVSGHKISSAGLKVDQTKVLVIETLLPPITAKGIEIFLGHTGFYRRFIKDFSKISRTLCRLLEKDTEFKFDKSCLSAFKEIKSKLVIALIMATLDWNKEFEVTCDASNYAMEQFWDKEQRKYSGPYTMPAKPSMRHKRTTLP